jgi:hypothetical protein
VNKISEKTALGIGYGLLDYFGRDYIEVKRRQPELRLGESYNVEKHYKLQTPASFPGESLGENTVKTQGSRSVTS